MSILDGWSPPGPVSRAFALDFASLVKAIMGPVGGGKTTTCIFAGQAFSASMPTCLDGVVRSKGVVVRDSFRTLEKTTLASWFQWFPKDHPSWDFTGGNDRPAVHTLRFHLSGGRRLESITEFVGIGDHKIEDILRGWEGSWSWMNEADLMSGDVLDYLTQRIRRYPSKRFLPKGVDPPGQVLLDLNAPDIDNWIYERFIENKPTGWAFYRQPGGREPGAENLENLPRDYYDRMSEGKQDWWLRRFIENKFGYSRYGTPVYPEFNELLHVAPQPLLPVPGLPIGLGLDAGGHPAGIIAQPMPNGQLRWLDEIYLGGGVGPERFSAELNRVLVERYSRCDVTRAFADPSAMHGADTEAGEMSWIDIVGRSIGRPVIPAGTNDPYLRTEAVRQKLTTMIDGRHPGLLVSPHLRLAIRGFAYDYRFEKLRKDQKSLLKPRPEKNEASNVHDAGQYITMEMAGIQKVIDQAARAGRASVRPREAAPVQRPGDFDVFSV